MNAIATTYADGVALLRKHYNVTSKDIQTVLAGKSPKFGYNEKVHAQLIALGIDPADVFTLQQKAIKRALQFVHATLTGDYRAVDATTACGTLALYLSPDHALEYDALHELIGGIARTEGASGNLKGVSRAKLAKMFARVGVNTVSTQKSRTWGDGGFAQALGMTFAPTRTKGRTVTLNTDHPLTVRFLAMIDRATDAQIDQIGGKNEE